MSHIQLYFDDKNNYVCVEVLDTTINTHKFQQQYSIYVPLKWYDSDQLSCLQPGSAVVICDRPQHFQ